MAETKGRTIRVIVIDEHAVVRAGVSAIIGSVSDMEVAGQAADGAQALELFRRLRPDIVITDLELPGMSGIELTTAIMRESHKARIIVFTARAGREDIYRALQVGACSYLL